MNQITVTTTNGPEDPNRTFTISGLEEDMLMEVQDGTRLRIQRYRGDINRHAQDCYSNMCMQYERPQQGQDCSEDLIFLHEQVRKLEGLLALIRAHGL